MGNLQRSKDALSDNGDLGLLSLSEAAAMLGIAEQTLRNWIAKRQFPFVAIGRRHMVLRDSLWEWLRSKEQKPYGRH